MSKRSLDWLIQHELQHVELNHFELIGTDTIAEIRNVPSFELNRRSKQVAPPYSALPEALRALAPLCLELQADHDASEFVLGAYSKDGWEEMRLQAAAISAMMVLIEREDAKHGDVSTTHPKAATRIFQLLGHLTEMPLIPAQLHTKNAGVQSIGPTDFPPPEDIKAFGQHVTIPSFFDAVALAHIAGAESISDDLGDPDDFFHDITVAKTADPSRYSELRTTGAKQWGELVLINEQIKPYQSLSTGLEAP